MESQDKVVRADGVNFDLSLEELFSQISIPLYANVSHLVKDFIA